VTVNGRGGDLAKACRAPGTSCSAHTRVYRGGTLAEEGFPVEQISEILDEADTVVWLDLLTPTREDLALVTEELGLHELAIDDALNENQRPKLDRYQDHLFLSAYTVRIDDETAELETGEVAAFITARALVSVRKCEQLDVGVLLDRWDGSADHAGSGVSYLLHGLLDLLVDGHFEAVQELDEQIDSLEDVLFDEQPRSRELQRRSFEMRKSLVVLRRVVLPMREVVNQLIRRDTGIVDAAMAPYFQDVYDHVLRATEWTESLRDLVSTILETNLTLQGNRLNEVMRTLAAGAALLAVTTAVTGFYGQNVPYPGYGDHWGFVTSTVILVGVTGWLYWWFKKHGWL
jgi:magnesium transporter